MARGVGLCARSQLFVSLLLTCSSPRHCPSRPAGDGPEALKPAWPISVVTAKFGQPIRDVSLPLGTAILFVGSCVPHWRDRLFDRSLTSMSLSFDRVAF